MEFFSKHSLRFIKWIAKIFFLRVYAYLPWNNLWFSMG